MNRTDRLLAIVLELQGKRKQRAEDLAATFEVTKRTIYRDILALSEAGVPIVSTPGQGYTLMEGYFLPALIFSTEEATMLLLGTDSVAQIFDAQYRTAALSAIRKIEAVLPEPTRQDVQSLKSSIRFFSADAPEKPAELELLQQLRHAIIERRTVRFRYHARLSTDGHSSNEPRQADPLKLAHTGGAWILRAFDHLRQDVRHFRLERMDGLEILEQRFVRPADSNAAERHDRGNLVVKALFDQEVARWVKESRFFHLASADDRSDGLIVTLVARQAGEVIPWLLSWGSHVRVIEPEAVRRQLIQEANGMLKNHRQTE